ncbi:MAG: hypothetical protein IH884_09710 [Myxococcales bacterium]|nr:hypothetical protein [Myxococcales bacterium]
MDGTSDDALFQGEVWGNPVVCAAGGGTLDPGEYEVSLYFAEIYFGPGCPHRPTTTRSRPSRSIPPPRFPVSCRPTVTTATSAPMTCVWGVLRDRFQQRPLR